MAKIDAFFKVMRDQNASDLHLAVGEQPTLRINGALRKVDHPKLTDEMLRSMLREILTPKQVERMERPSDLDFAFSAPGIARFRGNVYRKNTGLAAAFRMIPFHIRRLDEILAPEVFKSICESKSGLVLVTGPRGSGKSATLAACIDHINQHSGKHIICVEDPIEFVHAPLKSMISQREIGAHCESFAEGLRSALREDPDVILVSELRDLESIQLALYAAETGHLVFGSLYTGNAESSVDRIIDVFPGDRQPQIRSMLTNSLRAVISQLLLPRADGRGRVAVYEILMATPAVRALIREHKSFLIPSAMGTGREEGMQTLEQGLRERVEKELVSPTEASKYADILTNLQVKAALTSSHVAAA